MPDTTPGPAALELPWEDLTPDKPYATYPCAICRSAPGDSDNGACSKCASDYAGVPEWTI